jgi:hypothetical protein
MRAIEARGRSDAIESDCELEGGGQRIGVGVLAGLTLAVMMMVMAAKGLGLFWCSELCLCAIALAFFSTTLTTLQFNPRRIKH